MDLNNIHVPSLNEVKSTRAKVESENSNQPSDKKFDTNILSFKNFKIEETYDLRFMPDGASTNLECFRERSSRRLEFNSIKVRGVVKELDKPIFVDIPAFNHNKVEPVKTHFADIPEYVFRSVEDPVYQITKDWYETDRAAYDKIKRRTTYLYQGFVRHPEYEPTLVRIPLSSTLHEVVNTYASPDSEFEVSPLDFEKGRTFRLRVSKPTTNMAKASYSKSGWAMQASPLTEAEKKYLEEHDLYDLKTFISKKPDEEHLVAIKAIFEAYMNGQPFDYDAYGDKYRPFGVKIDDNGNVSQTSGGNSEASTSKPVVDEAPVVGTAIKEAQVQEDSIPDFDVPAHVQQAHLSATSTSSEDLTSKLQELTKDSANMNAADILSKIMGEFSKKD